MIIQFILSLSSLPNLTAQQKGYRVNVTDYNSLLNGQ